MALDLFVELPPSAREAWLKLSNTNSQQQMKVVMDKIARTTIDAHSQTAHAQLIAEMQIEHLEPLEDELRSVIIEHLGLNLEIADAYISAIEEYAKLGSDLAVKSRLRCAQQT
jgi:hypothetical protein